MKARIPQNMQGPGNMNQVIRQAQKMQEEMTAFQEEFASREFSASVGGGMVEITATGAKEITSVKIKPEVIDPEDPEMLEDLIMSAVNEILRNIEQTQNDGMEKLTGGMNMSMPGLF